MRPEAIEEILALTAPTRLPQEHEFTIADYAGWLRKGGDNVKESSVGRWLRIAVDEGKLNTRLARGRRGYVRVFWKDEDGG